MRGIRSATVKELCLDGIVRLDHARRTFGRTVAVSDVTLSVMPGEVFGLLGHNGAGKTTIIRLVNGLLQPQQGSVTTFGLDPTSAGHEVRRRTGVLTTYPALDEYLSPAENLAVYAGIHGLAQDVTRRRTGELLTRLGLDPKSREPCRGLSAGLKQRVALARALIHDPDLLLLDEPTANLDPLAARGVRDLVTELVGEGRTVIFSTHNLAEAEQLCDRVAILRNGQMLALGSLSELASGRLQSGLELRVGTGQTAQAREVLRFLDGQVTTAGANGLRIAGLGGEDVPDILRRLVMADVDVEAAVPVAPSLEDVYLAVHQTLGAA